MLRDGEGWRKGATWRERVNPDAPIDPQAIQIHKIKPAASGGGAGQNLCQQNTMNCGCTNFFCGVGCFFGS